MGAVSRVWLNSDAYLVCLAHAMSNESEEVMGLCIGELHDKCESCEISICAVMLLRRMDKRKDRVEISVEQLSNASTVAEELARKSGKPLRIVGWYHSHPHITVWPSHVDVQTQAIYQMMDTSFVGLIFSCFNESRSNLHQKVEMTCFQSADVNNTEWDSSSQYERIEIPIFIRRMTSFNSSNTQTLTQLPKILVQEENEAYYEVTRSCGGDILTRVHNAGVHAQTMCNITETVTAPLVHLLDAVACSRARQLRLLERDNQRLSAAIATLADERNKRSAGV